MEDIRVETMLGDTPSKVIKMEEALGMNASQGPKLPGLGIKFLRMERRS